MREPQNLSPPHPKRKISNNPQLPTPPHRGISPSPPAHPRFIAPSPTSPMFSAFLLPVSVPLSKIAFYCFLLLRIGHRSAKLKSSKYKSFNYARGRCYLGYGLRFPTRGKCGPQPRERRPPWSRNRGDR